MLKMSKPRKPTKNNPAIWHNKISDLMRLGKYCQSDVDAETELFLTLPMLSESERKIWLLDQKINQYGFQVDRPLVEKALKLIPEEIGRLDLEAQSLTCGAIRSTTQRNETLNFLIRHGVAISDLQAKTLSDFLKSDRSGMETPEALRVIEIRQTVSKTSTAKFTAFEQRSRFDGRCRENLLYYGASTGRWAGKGVQPQNFPRGSIKDPELACDVVLNHSLEFIRAMYGDPMETFSSILRGCIRAPEGFELFCGDWASIEVRVLFWCAHHALGLKAFVDGRDLYLELAPAIYGRMVTKEDKEERNTAKRAVLGCGYGMGDKRFRETCEEYGEPVSEEIAKRAVKAYRKTHAPVVTLWGDVEKAAIRAVRGTPGTAGRCKWFMEGRFLKCRLPSGRELAYCDPVVKWEATRFGTKHPKLSFMGVNSISKKWQRESTWGGKLVENIVQAISADLMREAMLRVDAEGYRIILTVHDELLAEKELSETSAEEFARLMAVAPGWAADLPLKVEGFKCLRYQK